MSSDRLARHWDAVYAEGDEQRSWTEPVPRDSLDAIGRTGAPPEAAIIDIGGGSSPLAAYLLAAGHTDITVLDISETSMGLARGRLGAEADAVDWITADVLAWRPPRRYEAWHDRAVLHFFIDPDDRDRYADTLRAALAVNGHAIIATFGPEGPDHCSGLPVQRHSTGDVLDLLGNDFRGIHSSTRTHRTPSGNSQPFVWTIAQRTA